MPITELKELKVAEVSLVDKPANRRRFLILKQENGMQQEDVLKAVLEAELEDEGKVDTVLKAAGLSENAQAATKGALRLLNAFKEEMPKDIFSKLAECSGYPPPEPATKAAVAETPEEKQKRLEEEAAAAAVAAAAKQAKAKKEDGPVVKADGSLDLSGVPEEVRPAVEAIWKSHQEAVAKAEQLQKSLDEEKTRRRTAEFIQKAEQQYSNLPGTTPVDLAPVLMAIEGSAPEAYAKLETVLKAADVAIKQGLLFKSIGSDKGSDGSGNSAWVRIEAAADKLVQAVQKDGGRRITKAQAIDRVLQGDKALYAEYLKEQKEARTQ